MKLTNLFRLHAILAGLYAIALIIFPQFTMNLLAKKTVGIIGIEMTRLLGAALVLITIMAWRAASLKDFVPRKIIALGLFVYTTLGLFFTLWGQLTGKWSVWGWSSVGTYAIFSIGYGFFLFLQPEKNQ